MIRSAITILILFLVCLISTVYTGSQSYVIDASQSSGPLTKGGLGGQFAVAGVGSPNPPTNLLKQTGLLTVNTQQKNDNLAPYSTLYASPKCQSAGTKMLSRLQDLCNQGPSPGWPGLDAWLALTESAAKNISGTYSDVVKAILIFNEPDTKAPPGFEGDPKIQGGDLFAKLNFVWTLTVKKIKSVDSSIKVAGPEYEKYTPFQPDQQNNQPNMRAFLQNAIRTDTIPDYIAFHQLGPNQGWVSRSINEYLIPLQRELGMSLKPVIIAEFGVCSSRPDTQFQNDFQGVPGTMIKYQADIERVNIAAGAMGIFGDGATLYGALRYQNDGTMAPAAGFWMLKWYNELVGNKVTTSRYDTRYNGALDGITTYNEAGKMVRSIFGGSTDKVDITVKGIGSFGPNARVRIEATTWQWTDNSNVAYGGDIVNGVHEVFDKTFPIVEGQIKVPLYTISVYDGYRLTVTPAGATYDMDPAFPKYEAENAKLTDCKSVGGEDGFLSSNGAYVNSMTSPSSAIEFNPNVPTTGLYTMTVRYAAGVSGTTHNIYVNGNVQTIVYGATGGGGNVNLDYSAVNVPLKAGDNTIRFTKGYGSADIDFMDLRPYIATQYRLAGTRKTIQQCRCYSCDIIIGSDGTPGYNTPIPSQGPYTIPGMPQAKTSQASTTSYEQPKPTPVVTPTPTPAPVTIKTTDSADTIKQAAPQPLPIRVNVETRAAPGQPKQVTALASKSPSTQSDLIVGNVDGHPVIDMSRRLNPTQIQNLLEQLRALLGGYGKYAPK